MSCVFNHIVIKKYCIVSGLSEASLGSYNLHKAVLCESFELISFICLFTVIVGATEQPVTTADEVMSCLDTGSAGRQVGTTNMNEHSSRSHTIFTLYIGKVFKKLVNI